MYTEVRTESDLRTLPLRRYSDPATVAMVKRISWGSIFAGAVVAACVQMMLTALGVGIGASTIDPMSEANPVSGLGMGAGIWWLVSGLIALFVGGWVAGRLAAIPRRTESTLHGLVAWAVFTAASAALLTSAAGAAIGGSMSLFGKAVSAVGKTAAPAISDTVRDLRTDPNGTINQLQQQGQSAIDQAQSAISDATGGQGVQGAVQNTVQNPQVQQQARQAADKAARGVSMAGWMTFAMLLLGALAASFGGMLSAPKSAARVS